MVHESYPFFWWMTGDLCRQTMHWAAYPNFDYSQIHKVEEYFRKNEDNITLSNLTLNTDTNDSHPSEACRPLFHLGAYMVMLPDNNPKKAEFRNLFKSLSGKNVAEARVIIDDALKNQKLIKNTGFGFFRFFHSMYHNIINKTQGMNNRFARSTTEELLIALSAKLKLVTVSPHECWPNNRISTQSTLFRRVR